MSKHVLISVMVAFLGSSLMPGFAVADKPESAGKPEWVEKHKAEKEVEKGDRKADKEADKLERKTKKEQEKAERELEKAEKDAEKEQEKAKREKEDKKNEGNDDE